MFLIKHHVIVHQINWHAIQLLNVLKSKNFVMEFQIAPMVATKDPLVVSLNSKIKYFYHYDQTNILNYFQHQTNVHYYRAFMGADQHQMEEFATVHKDK